MAAAHRLLELAAAEGLPVAITLYEGTPRLGGVFGTETVDGYRLERGADMFITDKPWALDLCRRLGLEDRLVTPDPRYRKSLILAGGRPVPTPDAFNLMVPGKLWPILTTPLLTPLGKLRLMAEPFVPPRDAALGDESLADFVRRRLGREALERIVQPLVGGIYTGDPERLSLAATLPRFQQMEREQGSLTRGMWRRSGPTARKTEPSRLAPGHGNAEQGVSGARYGLFVSLQGGMGTLQDALRTRIEPRVDCRLDETVLGIDRLDGPQAAPAPESIPGPSPAGTRYRIRTSSGGTEFEQVVIATPAYVAAELIRGWQPELAQQLATIEYASSAVVVSAHRLRDVSHPLDAYGLVIPARERRRILAVSFLSRKFPAAAPPDRIVLRTFVGGALQPELLTLPDDELQRVVQEELQQLLGVTGTPDVVRVVRYPRAMPQYHVGHLDRIARIEELTAAVPGLHLCGNAYRGVGLPDCIHSAELAAAAACKRVAAITGHSVGQDSPRGRVART